MFFLLAAILAQQIPIPENASDWLVVVLLLLNAWLEWERRKRRIL